MKISTLKSQELKTRYRSVLYIIIATLVMIFFTYLTPPFFEKPVFSFLNNMDNLKGDYPVYISRFLLSFILLGLIPVITVILCGQNIDSLGINIKIKPFKWYQIIIFLLLAVFFGITGGTSKELSEFYPYSRTLISNVIDGNFYYFIIHVVLYGILYYLPWEIFFRGFLMLIFIQSFEKTLKQDKGLLFAIIAIQTIPSTMLHFGHPLTELISAVPAGIIFGWLVYKTRSIFPAFILHLTVGIATDATIIIQQGVFNG